MKKIYFLLAFVLIAGFGFGQTTVSYDFSDAGAVAGLDEASPGVSLDANIGFGSFKNSGTSNPSIHSGQLRLYQNATKGGSIKIYASNGVTITKVIVHASGHIGDAAYTVDGGSATDLSGGTTYTMSSLSATSVVEFYQKEGGSSNRIYVDSFEVTYTSGGGSGPQDPTDFTIDNTTSTQIGLSWTNPTNSDGVWVVARQGAAPDVVIADGEGAYDFDDIGATGNFTTDTDLVGDVGYGGTVGNIVVYSGSGTSCIVTNLTEGNDYYFTIFNEYGAQDWSDGAQATPTNDVAEVQGTSSFAAAAGNTQAGLTWTNPGGSGTYWDGVLILAKSGGAVDADPTVADGSTYTANAAFGSGTEVGTANYVVYKGTGTTETVTALTNGTTYYFKTFVYDGSDWTPAGQTEVGNCMPSNSKVETFDNCTVGSSYADGDFVGENSITWSYVESRDENGDANSSGIDGNALMLRRLSDDSKVYSESISGGIGSFSVKLYKGFTGSGNRQVELFVNGISQGTSTGFDDNNEHVFTVNDINIAGNVVIRIDNVTSHQVIVDDITWSGYVGTSGLWKTDAASNDWATASNWDDNSVPDASTDVEIPVGATNYPTITAAAECNNITIKSDATGDASLIGQENLTVNGTATVERYVTGFTSATNGWHFLSSPVANYTISGSDFDPANGVEDLYRWGESTGEWLNYTGGTFSHTEFEVGLGYLVAYNTSEVKTFTGALNTADVTKNLTYNAGKGDGWNLIGNPFPSAIDADALTFSGAVNSGVYVVNPADGTYWAHNGAAGDPALADGEIPVNQGFFVEATGSGASVEIALADQVHSTNDFNKKDRALPKESLVVTLKGQTSENSTYFQFRDDATNEFDGNADAYKLFGWASIAQVYSKLGDTEYSINCLPHSTEAVMVPLGIKLSADEDLTLDFSGLETFFNTIRIDLEDTKTGMTLNVRENPSYSFHGEVADNPTRFILHFNGVTGIDDEMQETPAPQVYAVNQAIYINSSQDLTADVLIYNINGQLVGQDKINGEQLKRLELKTAMGMYLVTVKTADAVYTEKVMIK